MRAACGYIADWYPIYEHLLEASITEDTSYEFLQPCLIAVQGYLHTPSLALRCVPLMTYEEAARWQRHRLRLIYGQGELLETVPRSCFVC